MTVDIYETINNNIYNFPKKLPYITVSSKGISNGLSTIINDGADFGPDTYLNTSSKNRYGPPYTQTGGIQEALNSLPTVTNQSTGRKVPFGTVFIHFGGIPIKTQTPINVYDDWFINLISDDGFNLPVQPPNTPITYIQNVNGANAFNINANPVNNLANGFIGIDNLTFYTNNSTNTGTVFNSVYYNNRQLSYSRLTIGNLEIYDSTGQNELLNITTNGNDDMLKIGQLIAIGTTNNNGSLVSIGANHVDIDILQVLSLAGAPSTITNLVSGFMVAFGVGGTFNINVLDLFSYSANGAFQSLPTNGNSYATVLNINQFYDETGGMLANAKNENDQYCSISSRAITRINAISPFGQAFKTVLYPETLDIKSTPLNAGPFYTTIAGTTAGNVYCNSHEFSPSYKKYIITFEGYENDTTTNQTLNFAFPFSTTANITTNTTGLTISTTTTGITITSPNSTTSYNGIVIIEGY